MKRRTSLIAMASIVMSAAIASHGCTNSQSNSQNSSTNASNPKVLTLMTSPDYPPFEFYSTASGQQEIVGFDIEIAKYITKELGYELKVEGADFNGLIPALQSKRADFVMAGLTATEERRKSIDFSTEYFYLKEAIVALKGSNLVKPDDLAGKKVVVLLGSIQETTAKEIAKKQKGMTVTSLNKATEVIEEIKAKRADAAIIEDTVAKGFISANPNLEYNVIPPTGPTGVAIGFPKNSPLVSEFNTVLEKMKTSGEIERLAAEWFAKSEKTK